MKFEPHGKVIIHRIGNLLYIRLEYSLNLEAVEDLIVRMAEERKAFKGKTFLQIIDLRSADLFTSDGIDYIIHNARDTEGIHPAATVVVVQKNIIKRLVDDFYKRPERPAYPAAFRQSCTEALAYLIEQGFADEKPAREWGVSLREILSDRETVV